MLKIVACLLTFAVVGCSGASFTFDPVTTDGAAVEADAGTGVDTNDGGGDEALGAGGHLAQEKDGGVSVSTGAGGSTSTGGALGSTGGAIVAAGGSGGVATCTLVTHDNGVGQTWQDCVPLGTYNQAQAMKACVASGAVQCFARAACGLQLDTVRGYGGGEGWPTGEWGYGYGAAGYVAPGNGDGNLRGSTCGGSTPGTETWN